jgi:hypothetical protein
VKILPLQAFCQGLSRNRKNTIAVVFDEREKDVRQSSELLQETAVCAPTGGLGIPLAHTVQLLLLFQLHFMQKHGLEGRAGGREGGKRREGGRGGGGGGGGEEEQEEQEEEGNELSPQGNPKTK